MANGFVQVPPDSTGKKMQTFENTIGGNLVEAEAVAIVDPSGVSVLGTAGTPSADVFSVQGVTSGTAMPVSGTVGVSGNVTVIQPTGTNLHVVVDSGSAITAAITGQSAPDTALVGNPVTISGVDAAGNVQELPVADADSTAPAQVLLIGGVDTAGLAQELPVADSNTTTLPTLVQIGGAVTTAAPTYTTATSNPISLDVAGNLRVSTTPAAGTTTTVIGNKTTNSAAPSTEVGVLPALANAVSPLWTEGNQVLESVDLNGGQRTMAGNIPETTAAWTSATALNTAVTMANITGYSYITVTFVQTSTITGGSVVFEVSDTGTIWYQVWGVQVSTNVSFSAPVNLFALIQNTNTSFTFPVTAWNQFRVRLSTAITGTATVTVGVMGSAGSYSVIYSGNSTAVTGTVGVRGTGNTAALADNQPNLNFFTSSILTNDPLAVGDWVYGGAFSGTPDAVRQGWSKMRTPTVFKTVSVAATATGNTAVWTPGSGNKFRLLGLQVTAQGLSATATGVVTVSFQDGAVAIPF